MTTPPTGTVTFLFTDIERSTDRWEQYPDVMPQALERHDALMHEAVAANSGHVFKTIGDAFCAAFARAGDALAAAIDAQRAVADEDWSAFGDGFAPLISRMALHTGEATERGGDYFGPPVNRVARLESAGHGGQLLLSLTTQQIVRGSLPEGFSLRDWGQHRLKDLTHSEHIYQLVAPDLPEVETPLDTAQALHPRDRVVVVENAEARSVPDSMTELLDAVRGDEIAVSLSSRRARTLALLKPADLTEYRLGRIAEWSQPRYRLDGRFVELTLLIDQGEETISGRWAAREERHEDLSDLLDAVPDTALVLLGPPGSGKSTLLRRLELDRAIGALRTDDDATISFFIQLNHYRPPEPGASLPAPGKWLAERWAARGPDLPPLDDLLAQGRVVLLLDALNEIPTASETELRSALTLWKDFVQQMASDRPGNRIVFTCRSLDYSQPLSTPALRVPQIQIEPMTDEQVRNFLAVYTPLHWRDVWADLAGTPQLDMLRSPYFLKLLVDQVEADEGLPSSRAALFTGFVRQALRREIERDNPLFAPDGLLTQRDVRRVASSAWKGPHDLPARGRLIPKLSQLSHGMQSASGDGDRSQVRIEYDYALDLLDDEKDEDIVRAGEALSVLDEDTAADEIMYIHQLVQEYFAARELARSPDPELVRAEWRASEISPSVDEVIDGLVPADSLPGLPQTGWEETTLLAAAMAVDPAAYLRGVMDANLALAGRCAAQGEVLERLPEDLLDELRWAMVNRSRDPEADLRDRIACGSAVGALGDPRFSTRHGPHGDYLMPPLVEVPYGLYPAGDDSPIEFDVDGDSGTFASHIPRHEVEVSGLEMGRFLVTNAEWACFMATGGYEDERWWDTDDGRAWRRGELVVDTMKDGFRKNRKRLRDDPSLIDRLIEGWEFATPGTLERWRAWMQLDDTTFEEELDVYVTPKRETEPLTWRYEHLTGPTQPVHGICWYEARAYCCWLRAQSGLPFRLPTEVEWEAAARGREGHRYAWGEEIDRLMANTYESHVMRPTPVGVFPGGDTPAGVSDLFGNLGEWTSSLFGEDYDHPTYGYPYDALDGREDPAAPLNIGRVTRGAGWRQGQEWYWAARRTSLPPYLRTWDTGFRVVAALPPNS